MTTTTAVVAGPDTVAVRHFTGTIAAAILSEMSARILIVEDERELATMMLDYLTARGYEARAVCDGAAALKEVFSDPPRLVVLDLNLPGLDGIEVARTIRSQTTIPIIIASARGEEEDRLDGFDVGADDYVVKPVSLPELTARIGAILRRADGATSSAETDVIRLGDLVVDRDRRRVTVGGRIAHLTAAQFSIIEHMASSPGRVFSRMQLLESFQADPYEGYERTIDVHIKNIRKQIEEDPRTPRRLTTEWGVGYRLEEPRE